MKWCNKTAFAVFLALFITCSATDCSDVSDFSVANCCVAYKGSCEGCNVGYGLSKDSTQCNKCTTPNCANCDLDANVCKTPLNPPIPNCNEADSANSECYTCDDGYRISGSGKCVKCIVKNCSDCGSQATCSYCLPGYGLSNGGKACPKCTDPKCYFCGYNNKKCTQCIEGYGIQKGKCQKCRVNVAYCDAGEEVQCKSGLGLEPDGKGGCKKCASPNEYGVCV